MQGIATAMTHRIWLSTGGTGGHLFPALALAEQLCARDSTLEIFFLGGGLESSRYFDRTRYPYLEIPCGSLAKKNPIALLRGGTQIARGVWQAQKAMRMQRPSLLVGFGSFYSFPPLLAACFSGVPLLLHAADAVPGRVIRLMARYAALTVVQFPEAAAYLRGPTAVAQMPLRAALKKGAVSQAEARLALGLDPARRTLLVFGGSQGAQRINQLVSQAMASPCFNDIQLLHYTGNATAAEELQRFYANCRRQACVKSFEARMELAWSAADMVIGRAGASTIAELCEFDVPGLLIPYPYAKDNHQEKNAEALAARTRGIICIRQADLSVESLTLHLSNLLAHDAQKLLEMQTALVRSKTSQAQVQLCDLVLKTLIV
jgi:UDP-N-acetylglucosamine--N-acetylmuramyl-(pentapeptide) pyrophosphoryl-undecaprenol N-acetylglucosamine transferase